MFQFQFWKIIKFVLGLPRPLQRGYSRLIFVTKTKLIPVFVMDFFPQVCDVIMGMVCHRSKRGKEIPFSLQLTTKQNQQGTLLYSRLFPLTNLIGLTY